MIHNLHSNILGLPRKNEDGVMCGTKYSEYFNFLNYLETLQYKFIL